MQTSHTTRLRAHFGLVDPPRDELVARRRAAANAARQLDRALKPGQIALVTGPSGSGKSLILHALARRTRVTTLRTRTTAPTTIDAVARALRTRRTTRAMAHLARVGLADATLAHIAPMDLSEGQRFRLQLALALARAKPGGTIAIDECCSTLDRLTAIGVCLCLRRMARTRRVRVVCATARDEVLEWLAPEVLVEQPLKSPARVLRHPERTQRRRGTEKSKVHVSLCVAAPLCSLRAAARRPA